MKKNANLTLLTLLLALVTFGVYAQNPEPVTRNPKYKSIFRVAFYNVENLFDTIDDPHKNDNEFLPGARIPWTAKRYELKLNHLAQVIDSLSQPEPVAVMGLAEVENRAVLDDLVATPEIVKYNFQIIHRESPDERGIDNALLYDENQFEPVYIRAIPVIFPDNPRSHTRDILYVKGVVRKSKKDTLNIFVNHWPSRYGGQEESAPKRFHTAEILKAVTDSLFKVNPQSLIVIVGDFNDEPEDKSLEAGLNALSPTDKPNDNSLYDIMDPLYKEGKGSLYYNDWDMFDQVILSGNFWNRKKGISFKGNEGNIFDARFLMFKTNKGVLRPNRTAAKDYYGGYSDHLPVFVDLGISR